MSYTVVYYWRRGAAHIKGHVETPPPHHPRRLRAPKCFSLSSNTTEWAARSDVNGTSLLKHVFCKLQRAYSLILNGTFDRCWPNAVVMYQYLRVIVRPQKVQLPHSTSFSHLYTVALYITVIGLTSSVCFLLRKMFYNTCFFFLHCTFLIKKKKHQ